MKQEKIERKNNNILAIHQLQNNDQEDDDLVASLNLEHDDLIIWPLEQVQKNFKEFYAQTINLNLENAKDRIEFPNEMQWPTETDVQQMFQKSMSKVQGRQNKKTWKDNEKQYLTWIIILYCLSKNLTCKELCDLDWRFIAQLIVGRNATQCKYKWLARSKFKLVQVPWSKEEDEALAQIYMDYQKQGKHSKWSEIAKEIALRCKTQIVRQGKQCRERWINKLDPQISKGPWTKEEELTLLQLILKKGKKWSEISKIMKNTRTENSLKNRYHTIMKKERNKQQIDENFKSEIIDLLSQHNQNYQADNLVHLYEDIEPNELKIILQVIDRLSEITDKPIKVSTLINDQRIEQEQQYKQRGKQDNIIEQFQQKNEDQNNKQKFLNIMEKMKVDLDDEIKKLINKQDLDQASTINIIKQILKPQENETQQLQYDQFYDQMILNFQSNQVEFEVEGITNIAQQDIEDCFFGIVDFEQSNIYMIPQKYIQETINKISQQQTNNLTSSLRQSAPQSIQQSLQLSNLGKSQFDYELQQYQQQIPVQLVYPQIVYQPIGQSLNLSWMQQPYYPQQFYQMQNKQNEQ